VDNVFPDAPFPGGGMPVKNPAAYARARAAREADDDEPADGANGDEERHPPVLLKVDGKVDGERNSADDDDDDAAAGKAGMAEEKGAQQQRKEDAKLPRDDSVGARAQEADRDDDDEAEPIVAVDNGDGAGKGSNRVPAPPPPPGMDGVVAIEDEDGDGDEGEEDFSAGAGSAIYEGPPPYRGILQERRPRVMVSVISGGIKPTTKANRDAVIETWFDENSYIATHEEVATDHVLWLSDEAESGGFKDLPRKVKHMWAHMYENYLDKYDWFVKVRPV
jgi:hypothetical protein